MVKKFCCCIVFCLIMFMLCFNVFAETYSVSIDDVSLQENSVTVKLTSDTSVTVNVFAPVYEDEKLVNVAVQTNVSLTANTQETVVLSGISSFDKIFVWDSKTQKPVSEVYVSGNSATPTPTEKTEPTATALPTATAQPITTTNPEGDGIIHLNETSIDATGISGVTVNGTTLTITSAGEYKIEGSLTDGQIAVASSSKEDEVILYLDNVSVTNSTLAPFSGTKGCVTMYLTGTNTFTDTNSQVAASTRDNGCVTNKHDLIIKSTTSGGKLVVNGNYENGIRCKNDLEIGNADIEVTAVKSGIKGDESIKFTKKATNINITSGGDGIKTDYIPEILTDETGEYVAGGSITINGGNFVIVTKTYTDSATGVTETADGMQADLNITIANSPIININATGDGIKANASSINSTEPACIGGDGTINIAGGDFTIVSGEDGVKATKEILISAGNVGVNAKGDGIQAGEIIYTDSTETTVSAYVPSNIEISGGTVTVTALEDGIQSQSGSTSNNVSTGGTLTISGGTVDVTSTLDGIQADTVLNIKGDAVVTVLAHGGTSGSSTTESAKGLKAGFLVNIEGGTIDVNSYDDAVHSNYEVDISGGDMTLASTDDGVHGDSFLVVWGGKVNITKSYEGIEAAEIYISGGEISLVSSDDGANGAGEKPTTDPVATVANLVETENVSLAGGFGPGSSGTGGGVNPGGEDSSSYGYIAISGGSLFIMAEGDGFDSNGNAVISGGTLLINGPTNGGNGVFDIGDNNNTLYITGGTVIGEGSSDMAVYPSSTTGSQAYVSTTSASLSVGAVFNLPIGSENISYKAGKKGGLIFISTPNIVSGSSYTLSYNGTYSGGSVAIGEGGYGLLTGGTYSGGSTVSLTAVTSGSSGGSSTRPGF